MIQINIKTHQSEPFLQKISFFTEESWQEEKKNYQSAINEVFSGKKNEVFILADEKGIQYMIGFGSNPPLFELQKTASAFSYNFRKKIKSSQTFFQAAHFNDIEVEEVIKGLYLGTYEYPFLAEHPYFSDDFQFFIQNLSKELLDKIKIKTLALCEGQFACMEWLNKPQNFKQVHQINDFINDISEKYSLERTVFNKEQSEKLGLGAFLAVNQGSAQGAAFTILEYNSKVENAKTVGLVGKCVLFDTGGISIKGAENLHYMKSDMGGATAVLGTIITAAAMKLPINIIAILPITDNAVSNTAYLPSDVITAYNGKTIEVLNTDAEGRMTLADGLSYLSKNYKTDVLLDLATLTGSSVRMFGYTCGAYFSNNDDLKKSLEFSADATNQRLWNLPLWDIWKEDFTSDVADFKNISSKPFGDCIIAGKFLEQFIENHPKWAHLDIAGVAFGNIQYMKEKGATGYGVQLLIHFLENL